MYFTSLAFLPSSSQMSAPSGRDVCSAFLPAVRGRRTAPPAGGRGCLVDGSHTIWGWGDSFTTRKRWKKWNHRGEALPAPTLITVGILASRMRMGQGLPLCTNTLLQHQPARQRHFKPSAHRDQDVGTRGGQALTETILRPPVPSLCSHRQILLVVWAPAKRPHPSSRDRNFPVASGYSERTHTLELVTQLWCTRMAPTHPRRPDSPTEKTAALHRGHRPL